MFLIGKLLENDALYSKLRFWRTAFALLVMVSLVFYYLKKGDSLDFLSGKYVAKVSLTGFISGDNEYVEFISQLGQNKSVSAVLLQIDSPGGSLVGSEKVYEAVLSVAKSKPVVSVFGNFAASGGYMVAVASDHIVARPSSITGSIGVVFQYYGVYDLAKKLGVKLRSVKSSDFKASPSPLEDSPQSSFDEMKPLVGAAYKHFVSIVQDRRESIKNPSRAFSGRVFLGSEALLLGLVDELGNEDNALQWLKDKGVNTKNTRVVSFRPAHSVRKGVLQSITSTILGNAMLDNEQSNGLLATCCNSW